MRPIFIGLAGLSGAGKSSLVEHLEAQGGVKRLRFDAYYKNTDDCPKLPNGQPHWDLPESLYLDQFYEALVDLRNGEDIFVPVYNRRLCARTGTVLFQPRPVIFVEGMQLYFDERIRNMFDVRLWLEVPEQIALERRLKRQPDYDLDYYRTIALPAQRAQVLPMRALAHEILDGTKTLKEVAEQTDYVIQNALNRFETYGSY